MPRTSTARRRDEARERILEAAVEVIRTGGFRGAQMSLIALRAGVGVGSLYTHFPSQADLFAEIYQRVVRRELGVMREAVAVDGGPALARLAVAVRGFCERSLQAGPLAYALMFEPSGPAVEALRIQLREAFREVLADLVALAVTEGAVPAHDVAVSSAAVVGVMTETLVRPLSPAGAPPADGFADRVAVMALGVVTAQLR